MNRNSSNPCGTIALEYNRQTIWDPTRFMCCEGHAEQKKFVSIYEYTYGKQVEGLNQTQLEDKKNCLRLHL
jgi:hypothetical protein